jgi:glycosyltransferase involved in cell wall biosynthesis
VGFFDFPFILECVCNAKEKFAETELSYMLHDFHALCPDYNLMAGDFFCNLECKKHQCKFSRKTHGTELGIEEYRNLWKNFFMHADSVTSFSESSKEIFLRVYGFFGKERIKVLPHDMSYCNFTKAKIKQNAPVNIGIVGATNTISKGKKVVEFFLANIPEEKRISMIGTEESQFDTKRKNVIWCGRYEQKKLQSIVEENSVTHVIFPSVWPETFSYLVSEIMKMELPVFCFDLGAQSEKVKNYAKGKVFGTPRIFQKFRPSWRSVHVA